MKAADAAKLDMFAELDCIEDMGEMTYHEKHAFNLEHLAGVTCLTYLRFPNFLPLVSMSHHIYQMTEQKDFGIRERIGFFFASGDSFGCVKVWEVDRRASLFTFNFQEHKYNDFEAGTPPKVFAICQVRNFIVCALAHQGQGGIIQVYDLITKKDVECI